MTTMLRFESQRDSLGYDPYFDDDPDYGGKCYEIRARGGPMLPTAIDEGGVCAFEMLSQINPKDEQAINSLCDDYGFPDGSKSKRFAIESFQAAWAVLAEVLGFAHKADWPAMERAANELLVEPKSLSMQSFRCMRVPGKKEPQLVLVSRNLFRFAVLQLCAAVADGQEIKRCPSCRSFFPAGGSSRRKKDGIFCSTKCRVAAHRAKT